MQTGGNGTGTGTYSAPGLYQTRFAIDKKLWPIFTDRQA
jgi:hypothetical protein